MRIDFKYHCKRSIWGLTILKVPRNTAVLVFNASRILSFELSFRTMKFVQAVSWLSMRHTDTCVSVCAYIGTDENVNTTMTC